MLFFSNDSVIWECLWVLSNISLDQNKDVLKRVVLEDGLIEILFQLV